MELFVNIEQLNSNVEVHLDELYARIHTFYLV